MRGTDASGGWAVKGVGDTGEEVAAPANLISVANRFFLGFLSPTFGRLRYGERVGFPGTINPPDAFAAAYADGRQRAWNLNKDLCAVPEEIDFIDGSEPPDSVSACLNLD